MINNNWEEEWEKQYGESLFQHINCECGSCCSYTNNLNVKNFIQSLLDTKNKADAELKLKADAEKKEKAEAKKLAKMGDDGKIKMLIASLQAVQIPQVNSEEAKAVVLEVVSTIQKLLTKLENF